jgi:hypothetical protein
MLFKMQYNQTITLVKSQRIGLREIAQIMVESDVQHNDIYSQNLQGTQLLTPRGVVGLSRSTGNSSALYPEVFD